MAENVVKGFQTNRGTELYDYNSLANKPTLIELDSTLKVGGKAADAKAVGDALGNKLNSDQLQSEINKALAQAKDNGDFKGEPGDDYILTNSDKTDIANIVLGLLPTWTGGSY